MPQRGRVQERGEHDQDRQRQQRDRADQHIGDRFEAQQEPVPRLLRPIGAIEADAQAFDAARRKIDRGDRAQGQHIAARGGEHAVRLAGDRLGDLLGPRLEQQVGDLVGEILGAQECGQRGDQDQERKHRHQGRERDMAGDRPAVVIVKTIKGIERDRECTPHGGHPVAQPFN